MTCEDLLADIQSKAEALDLARRVSLIETLEDPLALGLFDAGARIFYRDPYLAVASIRLGGNLDGTAGRGELDGIRDYVDDNAAQLLRFAICNNTRTGIERFDDLDILVGKLRLKVITISVIISLMLNASIIEGSTWDSDDASVICVTSVLIRSVCCLMSSR